MRFTNVNSEMYINANKEKKEIISQYQYLGYYNHSVPLNRVLIISVQFKLKCN